MSLCLRPGSLPLALLALLAVWLGAPILGTAQSLPSVVLALSRSGCPVLTGTGWNEGDRIVVNVGRSEFHIVADKDGRFMEPTDIPVTPGADVTFAWRREDDLTSLGVGSARVARIPKTVASDEFGASTNVAPDCAASSPIATSSRDVMDGPQLDAYVEPIIVVGVTLGLCALAVRIGPPVPARWRRRTGRRG